MSLIHTFMLGGLRCHALEAGLQRLDGGAMFGVVPKPLWQKRIAPDDRNRIPLAMRCLLIEHSAGLVLVDSGLGNKEDAKFEEIYGAVNRGRADRTLLEDALAEAGFRPDDVRWLVNTHLHFDHAGGNTRVVKGEGGAPQGPARPTFPNATYVVQRGELQFARHTNERTRASYLGPNFEPVADTGQWQLIDGDTEILDGIVSRVTPGHVPHHQSILVQDGGETLCFLGDVMPTRHHVPLPWIMGYDLEPLRTLEAKRALARDALAGNWWLMFEHDPDVVMGRLHEGPRGLELATPVPAAGIRSP
jgi:glyoxylase-like metal-dependent hydrolase (beta-lactamase superfamily II)